MESGISFPASSPDNLIDITWAYSPANFPASSPASASQRHLWGILICIFATALTSLGLVLQKYSHTENEQSQKAVVYYRQPLWLGGLTIFMVGQIVNVIPMSSEPQVMLSSLGATALAFNAILAWIILGEEIRILEVGAMLGMLCGVLMVVCTTPRDPVEESAFGPSLQEIVNPLFSTRFLSVAALLFVSLLSLRLNVDRNSTGFGWPELDPITWTLCSAVASGYTVNLFKAVAELFAGWSHVQPQWHFQFYVLLFAAITLGSFQMHSLNRALNMGRAMMVVPTYCAIGLLSQLVLSELIVVCLPNTTASLVVFTSGIFFIVLFIVLLARVKIASEEEPDLDFEDVMGKTMNFYTRTTLSSAWKLPPDDVDLGESSAFLKRGPGLSTWHCDAYKDSFAGHERRYTVSVIGLGIA